MYFDGLLFGFAQRLPISFFRPFRGPGDPLTPFLFILVMETLSRLVLREELNGTLHGIRIARHAPSICHFLFAGDFFFL